jgi:hypothetical protein
MFKHLHSCDGEMKMGVGAALGGCPVDVMTSLPA